MKANTLTARLVLWLVIFASTHAGADQNYQLQGKDLALTAKVGKLLLKSRQQLAAKNDFNGLEKEIQEISQVVQDIPSKTLPMQAQAGFSPDSSDYIKKGLRSKLDTLNQRIQASEEDLVDTRRWSFLNDWFGLKIGNSGRSMVAHGATEQGIAKLREFHDRLKNILNGNDEIDRERLAALLKEFEITKQSAVPMDKKLTQETFISTSLSYEKVGLEQ